MIVNVSVSPGSGSVTSAARSMFVGIPASTVSVVSSATGGRLLGGSTSIVTAPATVWPCWSSTVYENVAGPAKSSFGSNDTVSSPGPLEAVVALPPCWPSQQAKNRVSPSGSVASAATSMVIGSLAGVSPTYGSTTGARLGTTSTASSAVSVSPAGSVIVYT